MPLAATLQPDVSFSNLSSFTVSFHPFSSQAQVNTAAFRSYALFGRDLLKQRHQFFHMPMFRELTIPHAKDVDTINRNGFTARRASKELARVVPEKVQYTMA